MSSKASCPASGAKRKVKCDICFEFADRPHRCGKECLGLFCEACLAAHFEHNSNCPCCRRRLISIWRRNRSSLFDESLHEHIQSLIAGGASIDDEDQAEIEQRERAHAASQAKQGELKQEYEAMLETQRQLRRIEAEENERKLRKFLASDPEFCSASPSQIRVRSEMFVAGEEEAAVVERLRREEEKLRKKLEQEQKDAEFARKLAGQLEGASSTGNLGENSRSSDGASSATRFANPSRKRSLHDNSQAGFSPRRKTFSEKPPLVVEKQRSVHALPRTARPTLSERNILSPTRSRDNVPAAAPRKRMAREPASSDIVDLVDLCSPTSEEAGVATPTTSATSEARSSKSRVQRPVQRWSSSPFGKSAGSEPSAPARTQRQKEHFNRAVPGNTLHRFLRLSQSPTNP